MIGLLLISLFITAIFSFISFYISKDKRYGRCIYEMFKHCINIAGDKEIIYIPLHKDMILPERICRNGIIKKYAVKEWLEKVENKYK